MLKLKDNSIFRQQCLIDGTWLNAFHYTQLR